LPEEYYALIERYAAAFCSDETADDSRPSSGSRGRGLLPAPPKVRMTAETDMEFYRRKQSTVTVRHVSGDRIVAVVEVVSPGNKAGRHALEAFVEKAADFLEKRVHLLILDLHPPGSLDPQGIHGAIWAHITGVDYKAPRDKRLTLERDVGQDVPLEATYRSAFQGVPHRWRRVLEGAGA
jgi:hypothetical protein